MRVLTMRIVEVFDNCYLEILRRDGCGEALVLRRWCGRAMQEEDEQTMLRFMVDELYEAWAVKYDFPMP